MLPPGHHTLIRQQKNEQDSGRLKDEHAELRIAAAALNSGPHMTNAGPVIIQQHVCRGGSREREEKKGPLWEQISLVPPEGKASANRFKIRPAVFNLGWGAGAAAGPTWQQDWAHGTRWGGRGKEAGSGVGEGVPPTSQYNCPPGSEGMVVVVEEGVALSSSHSIKSPTRITLTHLVSV